MSFYRRSTLPTSNLQSRPPRWGLLLAGLVLGATLLPWRAAGQGSLTPPGPPAPTMKTLDQIQPRTPIFSLPIAINSPGSYYLTTNLYAPLNVNGITVNANDVTLDLNGFALTGQGNASGILAGGTFTNLCVRNGTLRNWQVVAIWVNLFSNCRFEKLRLVDCAQGLWTGPHCDVVDCDFWNAANAANAAVYLADGCVVRNCVVTGPSHFGIQGGDGNLVEGCVCRSNFYSISLGNSATVRHCSSTGSTSTAILTREDGTVEACQAIGVGGGGTGIAVGNSSRVQDCLVRSNATFGITGGAWVTFRHCTAINNASYGFDGGNGCIFDGCLSVSNSGDGFLAGDSATLTGCTATGNQTYGIFTGVSARVADCNVTANQNSGIYVDAESQVLNCHSVGNTNDGVFVRSASVVSGCLCAYNGLSGIYVYTPGCQVLNNTCSFNNSRNSQLDAGIYIDDSSNRVDGNHVMANGVAGIVVAPNYSRNVVVRNSSVQQSLNYNITGNDVGPIGTAATSTSPWANISD